MAQSVLYDLPPRYSSCLHLCALFRFDQSFQARTEKYLNTGAVFLFFHIILKSNLIHGFRYMNVISLWGFLGADGRGEGIIVVPRALVRAAVGRESVRSACARGAAVKFGQAGAKKRTPIYNSYN